MMDRSIINAVQAAGFDVWMRDPSNDWLLFTDGKNIGYLQSGWRGISTTTVHHPNQTSGTGFQVDEFIKVIDRETLTRAFIFAPHWADGRSVASVKKYRDIEDFRAASAWNAGYQKVGAGK